MSFLREAVCEQHDQAALGRVARNNRFAGSVCADASNRCSSVSAAAGYVQDGIQQGEERGRPAWKAFLDLVAEVVCQRDERDDGTAALNNLDVLPPRRIIMRSASHSLRPDRTVRMKRFPFRE
jgi:hypothetical protein